MPPDTAPAAQPTNDTPATPVVDDKPSYASINDLDHEMTAEEEQAFVNETLGIKGAKDESVPKDKPADPPAPDNKPPVTPELDKPAENPTPEVKPDTQPAPTSTDPVKPETPKPTTELTEPQTDDLWVEVEGVAVDSEGKESTKTVKLVYDPANPNTFLPDDFKFKSDKQLMDIMEAKAEMANLYKERVGKYDADKADKESKETTVKTEAEQTAAWDAEIQDLITAGILEAPKVTDQKDPKFLEDPTVAKVDAVFKLMAAENATRKEAGQPLLRSFGTALNILNVKEATQAEENKTKKENELAKARGALVGGTSAPSTAGERPVYTAGSAHSIWDVKIPD